MGVIGMDPGFHTRDSSGFSVTFDNGFTVSVQFGFGTYSEHRRNKASAYDLAMDSKDAEVAVLYPIQGFVPLLDHGSIDDVAGWVKPDEVAYLMAIVANIPKGTVFSHEPLKFRE